MEVSCNEQVEIVSKSVSRLPMLTLPIHPSAYDDDSPSGCSTPPFYSSASVPFKWEEEPGKPIPCTTLIPYSEPICMKKLIPPPRMSSVEYKVTRAPSPNTVLNGSSLRLVEGSTESGLLGHMERPMSGRIWKNKKVRWGMFGSWSWRSGRNCKMDMREGFGGSFVYPSYVAADFNDGRDCCSEYGGESGCVGEQARMGKLKKNRSFLNLSQVLPWKTRKSKKDGA